MRGKRSKAASGIGATLVKLPLLHTWGTTLLATEGVCAGLKKLPDRTRTPPVGRVMAVGYQRPSFIVAVGVQVLAAES